MSFVADEMEHIEEEMPTPVNLSSRHKHAFLRFVKAEKQFLKYPEKYPEYLEIMTADLNKVDFVLTSAEWIQILNDWVDHAQNEYHSFIRTNIDLSSLSDEDEELIQQIQENRLWTEPSIEEINCMLDHVGAATSLSDNLWTTISSALEKLGGPTKTAVFWKRVFQRLRKRAKAKKDLFIHITKYHPSVDRKHRSLSSIELRILKTPSFSQTAYSSPNAIPCRSPKKQLENVVSHCRICLASTSSKMTHIFSSQSSNDENLTILEKLNYCSCMSTKPSIKDGLPQFICMSCSVLLESAYQLKVLCSKTEETLLSLAQKPIQMEMKEEAYNTDTQSLDYESDGGVLKDYYVEDMNESNDITSDDNDGFIVQVVGNKEDYFAEDDEVVETIEIEEFKKDHTELDSTPAIEVEQHEEQKVEKADKTKAVKTASQPKSKRAKPKSKSTKTASNKCSVCNRTFSNAAGLKIHTKTHDTAKVHQCSICDKVFKTTGVLTIHMRSHTGERPYICEVCGKSFIQKSSFLYHTAVHAGTKKYHCTQCPYKSIDANGLRIHSRSHSGERPYHCDVCAADFKTCSNLRKHIRCKHKEEKSYETCGKAFKTVSAINDHRAIHSETKEFECQRCPYRASTKANLKIHDRTHTGMRPYECKECSLRFTTAGNMSKHMRNVHHKIKTHKCDQCDRSFFTRDSARKHMVIHTGLRPYTCPECPMSYSWYNGLRKHVKQIHANIKIPTETSFINVVKKEPTATESNS